VDPGRKLSAQRLSPRSNNSKGISTSSSKTTASSPPKQNRSTSKGEPAPGPPASAQVNHRQGSAAAIERRLSLFLLDLAVLNSPTRLPFPYKLVLRAVLAKRNAEYFSDLSPRLPKSRERAKGPTVRAGCLEVRSILLFVRDFAFRLPVVAVLAVGTTFAFANLRCASPFAVPVAKPHCESSSANGASHLKAESVEIICPGEMGQRS
jgi:hypothetical protein